MLLKTFTPSITNHLLPDRNNGLRDPCPSTQTAPSLIARIVMGLPDTPLSPGAKLPGDIMLASPRYVPSTRHSVVPGRATLQKVWIEKADEELRPSPVPLGDA